ncbi:MAG: hypothetical protein WD604_09095, partial [Balneolaceae bacterium]
KNRRTEEQKNRRTEEQKNHCRKFGLDINPAPWEPPVYRKPKDIQPPAGISEKSGSLNPGGVHDILH